MSNGYLEGVVRGYKGGLLTQANYHNLTQCENLEGVSRLQSSHSKLAQKAQGGKDVLVIWARALASANQYRRARATHRRCRTRTRCISSTLCVPAAAHSTDVYTRPQSARLTATDFRMQLSSTDYGNFLANEPLPLSTSTIADKATERLVSEFHYLRTNAVEPLATFMDYITYAYMIDNVILLTLGTLHERDTHELLERCHPLGVFDTMPALCVAGNVEELYHSVLVETPLGMCFLLLAVLCRVKEAYCSSRNRQT